MDRTDIVNVTRVTESFLQNLIKGVEGGLESVEGQSFEAAPIPGPAA